MVYARRARRIEIIASLTPRRRHHMLGGDP
jgi:hypothetical protein